MNKALEITVADDGIGMEPDVINAFYLKIGVDRRKDVRRGRIVSTKKALCNGKKRNWKISSFWNL